MAFEVECPAARVCRCNPLVWQPRCHDLKAKIGSFATPAFARVCFFL
jgi:hypothetical protein